MSAVQIRLMGTPAEVEAAMVALRSSLRVLDSSRPYACRGDSEQVRVYVRAVVPAAGDTEVTR